MGDYHNLAGLYSVVEDCIHGVVLALEHACRTGEPENRRVDAGSLYHASVAGNVSVKHGEAAVAVVGVVDVAYASLGAVGVELRIVFALAERLGGAYSGRGGIPLLADFASGIGAFAPGIGADGIFLEHLAEGESVDAHGRCVDQALLSELI